MKNKDEKAIFISVIELAKLLGISRIAVFNKIKKGQIKAQKIGRNYAIHMEDASDLINGNNPNILTTEKKEIIERAVLKVVKEYGQTLKLLGKE